MQRRLRPVHGCSGAGTVHGSLGAIHGSSSMGGGHSAVSLSSPERARLESHYGNISWGFLADSKQKIQGNERFVRLQQNSTERKQLISNHWPAV